MSDTLRNHGDAVRLVHELQADNERLRAIVSAFADKIEKLAFDMPPSNEHTPQFVMLANVARRALEQKP